MIIARLISKRAAYDEQMASRQTPEGFDDTAESSIPSSSTQELA